MPLYEWSCRRCGEVFEALVPLAEARRRRRCAGCGGMAERIVSLAVLPSGHTPAPVDAGPARGRSDVTRLGVPSPARLCWMDDRSAARLAAYKHGRGAEYDDVTAARAEARKRHGASGEASSAEPRRGHDHSPLADPAVRARRAAAARRSTKAGG